MAKVMKARRGRKAGVNKSQSIRDALAKLGSDARPKDVIAALKEQGIEASPALVTNVISRNGLRKRGRKARRRGSLRSSGTSHPTELSISSLVEAKKLVTQVGSVAGAKRALDALSKLL